MEKYYNNYIKTKIKDIDNINEDELNIISMYQYITNKEKPILGTYGLATCIAILIENNYGKTSLCHTGSNFKELIIEMLKEFNKNEELNVTIIPGSDTFMSVLSNLIEYLKTNFKDYKLTINIKRLIDYSDIKSESIEFAYDTRTKEYLKPDYTKILGKER